MSKEYFIVANTFKELMRQAYEKDEEVWALSWHLATDLYDIIRVKHQDSSSFHINSAFYRLCTVNSVECFVIFSEHNGILAFVKDDLDYFQVVKNNEVTIIYQEN